jgi:hypothetical protein
MKSLINHLSDVYAQYIENPSKDKLELIKIYLHDICKMVGTRYGDKSNEILSNLRSQYPVFRNAIDVLRNTITSQNRLNTVYLESRPKSS